MLVLSMTWPYGRKFSMMNKSKPYQQVLALSEEAIPTKTRTDSLIIGKTSTD